MNNPTTYSSPRRRRQEMRTFTVHAIERWLRAARIAHVTYRLGTGEVRVYATPTDKLDRAALARFGFSWSDEYKHAYRAASDSPSWVHSAPAR